MDYVHLVILVLGDCPPAYWENLPCTLVPTNRDKGRMKKNVILSLFFELFHNLLLLQKVQYKTVPIKAFI